MPSLTQPPSGPPPGDQPWTPGEEDVELAGLDALEEEARPQGLGTVGAVWSAVWPKLLALAIVAALWQTAVWTKWRPPYLLPGPASVVSRLLQDLSRGQLPKALEVTMARAGIGYAIALLIGTSLGLAIARVRLLREAAGSLIAGLQTMPSIAWFPLAILLFRLSEGAILFVVVLGAAPAIASGLISGVDQIPPVLLRAGRIMGAKGLVAYRHVILPASLPGYLAGLKQGWAFAWRSLMAGELLVIIAKRPSLGVQLQFARELSDAQGLMATMVVILLVGMVVDSLVFGTLTRSMQRRRGLIDSATPV